MARTVTDSADVVVGRVRSRLWPVPLRVAVPVAVVAGLITVLAFPRTYWWPTAPIGVALLALAIHRQRLRVGALLGALYGLAFFPVLLFWVRVVGYDAWSVLSVIETCYVALLGGLLALVSRLRWWPLWQACLWVVQEFVRSHFPFGGFSWGRLAFAETDSPYTPLASVGGAPLVTFAVALTGGLLAYAAMRAMARRPRPVVLAAAGALAVALVGLVVPRPPFTGESVTVAVVQGNVPRQGLDFLGQREAVLRNHAAATHQLAADVRAGRVPRPDFVLWPENASDVNPFAEPGARAIIEDAVKDVGAPVLVGTLVDTADGRNLENTGVVWDPETGPGDRYVKQHLVPFGEYVPLRPIMSKLVGRLDRIPRDFVPGRDPKALRIGDYRIGDVMCFDVAFDDAVRESIRGASMLTVQTNNATYGGTLQLDQQFSMSRMRAIEHGRPVAIAATSGISAVIDARGDVLSETKQFTRDVLVEKVALVDTTTLADRLGPWPERAIGIVGLFAVGLALWRREWMVSR